MVHARSFRAGLGLLAVLSALDVPLPLLDGPPVAVAVAGSVLGLASLALVVPAWRGATRAVPPLLVLRALSALSALPGLFVSGVPSGARAAAAAALVLNAVGILMVLGDRRASLRAGAR